MNRGKVVGWDQPSEARYLDFIGTLQMPSQSSLKDVLLNFKPPPVSERAPPAPAPAPPLHLLDRHIPDSLTLKRIEILPSLPNDLSRVVDAHAELLNNLPDNTFSIHAVNSTPSPAQNTLYVRERDISSVCCRAASRIILHPKHSTMHPLLTWFTHRKLHQYGATNDAFVVQDVSLYLLDFINIPRVAALLQPFDEETKSRLTALFNHSPFLAVGSFFSPSAHAMLADMERLADAPFPWRLHSDCKIQPTPLQCPPDAPNTLWNLPGKGTLRRSSRLNLKRANTYHTPDPGCIVISEASGSSLIEDFVQKAWSSAVHLDTTFIVFECGNFLRIGIRNRARQTLSLSNLIDICHDEPTHGRLWLGFHISAALDILERLPLLVKWKSDSPRPPKRPRAVAGLEPELTAAKRARLIQKKGLETKKVFSTSKIIALFFQWGEYDSPAPLMFWSPGTDVRPKYRQKEYLRVVINGKLGSGGTGDVYTAKVHSSHRTEYSPCVVKMANIPEKVLRLRQEYRVYMHLIKKCISGIPTMFGFYENREDNVCVLILANAGLPIALKMDAERRIHLKDSEITQVKAILDSIHAVGILHRDIRSWNILSDDGQMCIADFDRASFSGTEQDFTDERERLAQMTDGVFVDDKQMIGTTDTTSLETIA